jgi:DNA mismatch repair ATPase MutS
MSFITDKQTLDDLNILGRFNRDSIFNLYNNVKTRGGERLLESMFTQPLTDPAAINKRSEIFRYFQEKQFKFLPDTKSFQQAETYFNNPLSDNYAQRLSSAALLKFKQVLLHDEQYTILEIGIKATLITLAQCKDLSLQFEKEADGSWGYQFAQAFELLKHLPLLERDKAHQDQLLPLTELARYDYWFRSKFKIAVAKLLSVIHELDVWISVSDIAREKGFNYAHACPASGRIISVEGLRHPALTAAVPNNMLLDGRTNLTFLTGANMAGKSTLMKAFGIAVYLAHMGFPIAVEKMEFSVKDGIYTSINVADNLDQGLSHFYAEVLRIKKVAEEVSAGKMLVVIFDELFKGTNVKDAYDATLAVTMAFAKYKGCFFLVSTHITEVGDALMKAVGHVQYAYLPTNLENGSLRYSYKLKEGISTDRQGMLIIRNEGILELLLSDQN